MLTVLASLPSLAGSPDTWRGCGSVDYSWGASALHSAHSYAVDVMTASIGILYAGSAVMSIVSAFQIYIKLNTGEGEITKNLLYLFGGIFFMIGATIVMPALFGYDYLTVRSGSWWSSLFGW